MLKYKIGIQLIPGIGPVTAKSIIAYTGSIEGVFKEKKSNLVKIPGIGEFTAEKIINNRNVLEIAEKEIEFIENNNINTYFFLDKNYPELLKQCTDAPVMLYSKGKLEINGKKAISIVGTRNITGAGKENCEKLITDLKENNHNPIIVSGLAYGADICAHKFALKNGLKTIAVLGHGLNRVYPASHKNTATEISQNGAVITEYLSTSKFERQNFLQRNRVIAGLTKATVVVESAFKGGSLVTADIANSYNREVFAFPGRINDKMSVGCNKLIKQNKAVLLEDSKDIEYIIGWDEKPEKPVQQELFIELTEEEQEVLNILQSEGGKSNIDTISRKSEIEINLLSAFLLAMEFKNVIRSLPGKIYEVKNY